MKKSLKKLISNLQKDNKQSKSVYLTLKNIRGGRVADNSGSCTNGDCSGTNSGTCTNTGDCSHATNTHPTSCSNTGGPGCCGGV
jgi:hypothetical protein